MGSLVLIDVDLCERIEKFSKGEYIPGVVAKSHQNVLRFDVKLIIQNLTDSMEAHFYQLQFICSLCY
jgi:hypothetical protein